MYVTKLILENLDKNKPLFWDTETIGLYGRTRLVQVRQGDTSYIYDCFYINIEEIKYAFKEWHLVIHNAHYDLSCLDFKRWLPAKVDDTLLMARLAFPELESYSLKSLSEFLKLGVKTDEGASDWSKYCLTESQLRYAENDTKLVESIYNYITNICDVTNMNAYKLDIESLRFSCVYQHKGLPIDKKKIKEFKKDINTKLKNINLPNELNINSPKQVREFLNLDSSSKDALANLNSDLGNSILEKRKLTKALSYLEDVEKYDMVYSLFNPNGARTGRFTAKGCDTMEGYLNLQQIPRELKHIFGNTGGYFVTADYPALEIWLAGAIFADEFLVETLRNKEDLHYKTAETMFKKSRENISKVERTLAKVCNFTLLYGAGYKTLAQALINNNMSEVAQSAEQFKQGWLNTYKGINQVQQEMFNYMKTHTHRIVYTAMGRSLCAKSATEGLNIQVQGSGAECTKLALYLLSRENIIPVISVHDSIGLIASTEKEAKEYSECLKWCMEESYRRVIKNCKVNNLSLEVDIYTGENYE